MKQTETGMKFPECARDNAGISVQFVKKLAIKN